MTIGNTLVWILFGGCMDPKEEPLDTTEEVSDTSVDTSTDSGLMANDEDCTNGEDDDLDGEIDCDDSDCASEPSCPFSPQTNDYTDYERTAGEGYTTETSATQASTSGTGVGLTGDITVDGDGVATFVVTDPGSGYVDGEVVTLDGGTVGATVTVIAA